VSSQKDSVDCSKGKSCVALPHKPVKPDSADWSCDMVSPATNEEFEKNTVAAAKQVVSGLLLAIKMSSLYPDDHPLFKTAVTSFRDHLATFLEEHDELEFQVEKNRLLFDGKVVHEGEAKEGNLAFALFRDGIQTFTFQSELDLEEIKVFVGILDKYKSLTEESDGDIVTALWEADLPHIQYESAEHILEADLETEISLLEDEGRTLGKLPPVKEGERFKPLGVPEGDAETAEDTKPLPPIDMTSTLLTPEEIKSLIEMTRQEEERDAIREILNIMTDLLIGRQDEQVCDVVFDFLEEELQATLARKDFDVSLRILKGLRRIYSLCEETQPLSRARIDELFTTVSGPAFLSVLSKVFPTVSATDTEKAKEFLLLLPSEAIRPLASMILEANSSSVRKMLSEVVVSLAARNGDLLIEVVKEADDDLLPLLVPILGRVKDEKSATLLIKMAHHKSHEVRVEAVRAIMARDLWVPNKLKSLTDDESELIRELSAEYFGSRRSESAESVLLAYLERRRLRNKESGRLFPYIRALGRCGSTRCVPLLREVLLKGGWISRFRGSHLRDAAAYALSDLGLIEAKQILEQASRSRFKKIRSAAQAIIEDQEGQGDTP
jgi:HEAT repeat protein